MSTPVIKSFNSGELSPLLDARSDLEKYSNGCKILENMIPLTQGAATRRSGTEYIADSQQQTISPKLITFARSNALAYTLEFGENYMRVYLDGAPVTLTASDVSTFSATKSYVPGDWISHATINLYYCIKAGIGNTPPDATYWEPYTGATVLTNPRYFKIWTPYSVAEAHELKFTQSADTMYIVHPDYEVHKLTSTGSVSWTLEKVDFVYQALKDENIETGEKLWVQGQVVGATTSPADWIDNLNYAEGASVVFDDGGGNDTYVALRDISEYEDYTSPSTHATIWNNAGAGAVSTKGSLVYLKSEGGKVFSADDVGKYWLIKKPREDTSISDKLTSLNDFTAPNLSVKGVWNLITHGTWTGTIELQRSYDAGTTWVLYRTYSSVNDNNVDADGEEEGVGVLYRVQMTAYTSGSATIDLNVEDPYNFMLYRAVGYVDVNTLVVQLLEDESNDFFLPSTPAKYSAWAEGAWGGASGYPRSIAFFQERLCFGGNLDQSLTIWLSKIADYENLTTGVLDTSALIYTLASDKVNDIVWMLPHDKLLIGTTGDEWILGSNKTGEPMTPTNTTARRQSSYGSEDIQALAVNNVVFFVQRGARKVREMAYDYQSELYQSPDMTVMSEHITKGGIIDIKFQLNPYPILWALRADGVLLGFTYEKEQQVFAWHRHVTSGTFDGITVIPNENEDELWVTTERETHHIERFTPMGLIDDIEDAWFVDSGLEYDGGVSVAIGAGVQTAATPFTFNIEDHGFLHGDYIRVIADPAHTTESEAFPYLNQVFYVRVIDSDNFYIRNEANTTDWNTADHPYNFTNLRYEQVVNSVSGIDHLEGLEVNVVEDYAISNNKTVTSGAITLEGFANHVLVGLPFTSTLKPMNIETELADGGSQGRKKRITQAVIRFYLSVGCLVVSDEGEEMLVPFRKASDPMDESPPLKSGDLKVKYKDGYSASAGITIKQDVPLPMTILMIQTWINTSN